MISRHPLRMLLCVVAPLTVLGAGEWTLRRIDWGYVPRTQPRVLWSVERDRAMASGNDRYAFHPHQLWSPRPGAPIPWADGERFNADGYRGPLIALKTPPKTLRMVCLGGAATLGVGVRFEDTFPALTARLVTQRITPCEAMNLGVENFSMRQCLERYRDIGRPYQAQIVVLTISTVTSCMPAPGGMTDLEKIKLVRPLDAEREPRSPIVGSRSRFVQGLEWLRDALGGSYWVTRDDEFRLKRLEPGYGGLDWPGTRRLPIDDYDGVLALFRQETHQDSAHLLLISIPTPSSFAVTPIQAVYERVADSLAARELLVHIDEHTPHFAALRDEIRTQNAFGTDGYPTACGQYLIAETLADTIVRGIQARSAEPPYRKPETGPK